VPSRCDEQPGTLGLCLQGLHGVEGLHPDKTLARRFKACRSPVLLSVLLPHNHPVGGGGDPLVSGSSDTPHFPKNVTAQPMKGRPVLSSKMAGSAKCQQNQGMCRGHALCTRPVYHDRSGGLGGSTGSGEVRGAPAPSAGGAPPPDAGDTSVAALTSGAPPASPAGGAWKCGRTSWWFLRRAVAGLVPMEGHVQPVPMEDRHPLLILLRPALPNFALAL
jgi:hypothetical protein